jgi:hypothetical protein
MEMRSVRSFRWIYKGHYGRNQMLKETVSFEVKYPDVNTIGGCWCQETHIASLCQVAIWEGRRVGSDILQQWRHCCIVHVRVAS